jgi:hypothetical protein
MTAALELRRREPSISKYDAHLARGMQVARLRESS